MALESFAAMVDTLRRLRLLDPTHLNEMSSWPSGAFVQPYSLSRELMRRGWLTVYQVNKLHQGLGRELCVGRHRILDQLGEGGAGHVYKAWDTELKRLVALKVVREELHGNTEALGRFRREIAAAMKLRHPNIVEAVDANEKDGTLYLAMEFIQGNDLNRVVKLCGRLPSEMASRYLQQAAQGLQHAHEHKLVHRDIKPANLLVANETDSIKILDMGLSRTSLPSNALGASLDKLTMDGSVLGSPDFMSPEQARQPSGVDIRADIYSLGCTGYFLLTGQVPFPGNSLLVKLQQHFEKEPIPIEQLAPDVPAALCAVVRKMMAKKADQRYRIPAEVAAALA